MPWCPNCKEEYRAGFTLCIECGAELVDELDDEKEDRKKAKRSMQKTKKREDVFLVNVFDPVETAYITSMLDDAGIAYNIREEGSGNYMGIFLGHSFAGKNILVSKDDYEKAAEIVRSYHTGTELKE